MPKMFMLTLVLLCSAAWMQAQNGAPPDSPAGAAQSGTAARQAGQGMAGQISVEGCLQGSNGSFTVTDDAGATYQLKGDMSKLSENAGHQVQIMGSTSGADATSSASGTSQGNAQQQTLTVDQVKSVSDTCKTANK